MLSRLTRTLVKVVVASLIVGTILDPFRHHRQTS